MLQNSREAGSRRSVGLGPSSHPSFDFAGLRRQVPAISVVVAFFLAAGAIYLILRPPQFTAVARLLVDNRQLQMIPQNSVFTSSALGSSWAAPLVLSQVELLHSHKIAADALGKLRKSGITVPPPAETLLSLAGLQSAFAKTVSGDTRPALAREDRAVLDLERMLTASRVGETFVIEVKLRNRDPSLAAATANAVVQAYVEDITAANAQAAERASPWLRDIARDSGPSARVIQSAVPPLERDGPRPALVMAIALFGGLAVGVSLAIARDVFDRRIWNGEALATLLDTECFGALHSIKPRRSWLPKHKPPLDDARQLRLSRISSIASHVIADPESDFAQTIERVRIAATLERHAAPVIGVTAATRGEGASTVALNVALAAARSGGGVLLVDAVASPLRGGLTAYLAPDAEAGLTEVQKGEAELGATILREPETGLCFAPIAGKDHAPARLSPEFIASLTAEFKLVVVDLPPLSGSADVRAVAGALGGLLIVCEAGKTTSDQIIAGLERSGSASDRLLGCILNKVDSLSPEA